VEKHNIWFGQSTGGVRFMVCGGIYGANSTLTHVQQQWRMLASLVCVCVRVRECVLRLCVYAPYVHASLHTSQVEVHSLARTNRQRWHDAHTARRTHDKTHTRQDAYTARRTHGPSTHHSGLLHSRGSVQGSAVRPVVKEALDVPSLE